MCQACCAALHSIASSCLQEVTLSAQLWCSLHAGQDSTQGTLGNPAQSWSGATAGLHAWCIVACCGSIQAQCLAWCFMLDWFDSSSNSSMGGDQCSLCMCGVHSRCQGRVVVLEASWCWVGVCLHSVVCVSAPVGVLVAAPAAVYMRASARAWPCVLCRHRAEQGSRGWCKATYC